MWAAIKGALSKVWLWLVLALLVACGVLFALLRWEKARRVLAESRARTAEKLAEIRAKRHHAALEEQSKRREAEAEERKQLEDIAEDKAKAAAEHSAEIEEIESAAGDDNKVREALREALRRGE